MKTKTPTKEELKVYKKCKECYAYYQGKHECPEFLRSLLKKKKN